MERNCLSRLQWPSAGGSRETLSETGIRTRITTIHDKHRSESRHSLYPRFRRFSRRESVRDPSRDVAGEALARRDSKLGSVTCRQELIAASQPQPEFLLKRAGRSCCPRKGKRRFQASLGLKESSNPNLVPRD